MQCADYLKVKGDIVVTLCERDSKLRIYDANELTMYDSIDLLEYNWDSQGFGQSGFDIIQNGNSYNIFYTSHELIRDPLTNLKTS